MKPLLVTIVLLVRHLARWYWLAMREELVGEDAKDSKDRTIKGRGGIMPYSDKLTAVMCGGEKHQEFIKLGYKTHHLDGRIVYMQSPIPPHIPAVATVESSRQRWTKDRVKHRAIARRLKWAEVGVGG